MHFEGACIISSKKLLGININSELKFNKHIPDLCNKAGKMKANTSCLVTGYMSLGKRKIVLYCITL